MRKSSAKTKRSTTKKKRATAASDSGTSIVLVPLLESLPRVQVQKKAHGACFMTQKKVFAFTRPNGVAVKLPEEKSQELVDAGTASFLVMGKRTMREWVVVNHEDPRMWEKDLGLFRESIAFVVS